MTTNGLLNFLDGAPYGAFAVNMNKTIVFWNRGAERILEHEADQAIGARAARSWRASPKTATVLSARKDALQSSSLSRATYLQYTKSTCSVLRANASRSC